MGVHCLLQGEVSFTFLLHWSYFFLTPIFSFEEKTNYFQLWAKCKEKPQGQSSVCSHANRAVHSIATATFCLCSVQLNDITVSLGFSLQFRKARINGMHWRQLTAATEPAHCPLSTAHCPCWAQMDSTKRRRVIRLVEPVLWVTALWVSPMHIVCSVRVF
jgi:hypothetical protein